MSVARAFAAARENAGMNQREAAQRLGVNQSTVCFWETGRNFPRASMLVKMADLYCCSMDQLLGRKPNTQDSA